MRFVELNICRTVQEIMCKLNDDELGDLRTRHFWMKAEHLRMQAKVGKVTKQFRLGPIKFLPLSRVRSMLLARAPFPNSGW